ncbi:peptidylprolyl isomerase [Kribbella orskensis]|uniref:peptidylprolyl isomerase n=1 Tax=Kribbella orskensis TaxID=2512216 RepID=A0ABY2BK19_9ACTN|nr:MULTISPECIES: FKBP-type peptidyl-prolyl cis-trans isomerase [Kribbella]TCM48295.1 peptidylprolyl isomerase [Kribbella sp. VKM Ac-2568]TCN38417.1 peptidylprolyl isomerase [Kribbella sp. VKM Ac-2500]TCO20053.1 peptidylprolyl isomerase [Kribbella orskensis]
MRKLLSLVAVVALGATLAACGSEDSNSGGDFGKAGIKVTEDFGKKPTVTHRDGEPDKALVTEVLKEGDGPEVKKGELLTANYLGQIWRDGKVFDNSYDRGAPSSFPIGVGGVIAGWDEALVGKKIGSRVVMSIPSDKGYKEQGNEQAGIKGDDTLIFVVDLVGAAANDTKLDAEPVASAPTKFKVTGELNAEPKVTVPAGTKAPAKPGKPVIIALGKGKPIEKGSQLIGRYVVYDYAGKKQASTWDGQPASASAPAQPGAPTDQLQVGPGPNGQAGALDGLAGMPIGSRVLVELPAAKDDKGKVTTAFAVIDVLNAFPAPKQQGQ